MQLRFRQGIVFAPAGFLLVQGQRVSIRMPASSKVMLTISDSGTTPNTQTNYLFVETQNVDDAWIGPFTAGNDYWLYWDLDILTGKRTFGHTLYEPVSQPTPPQNPNNDQHWFDTIGNNMKVWNSTTGRWTRRVRVFACKLSNGSVPISMSINSTAPYNDFIGTQIGALVGQGANAGSLLFDSFGKVLRKSDGTFFTTEDQSVAAVADATQVKVGSIIISAKADTPMSAYTIVRFTSYDTISPAYGVNLDKYPYGIILSPVGANDATNVVTSGIVENENWDFEHLGWPVNTPVYVGIDSKITNIPQPLPGVFGSVVGRSSILIRPASIAESDTNISLNNLDDVVIVNPVDGDHLIFEGGIWKNAPPEEQINARTERQFFAMSPVIPGTLVCPGTVPSSIRPATNADAPNIIGMVKSYNTQLQYATVVLFGVIQLLPTEWQAAGIPNGTIEVGKTYFLGENTTAPVGPNKNPASTDGRYVLNIGVGISPTEMLVDIKMPIKL